MPFDTWTAQHALEEVAEVLVHRQARRGVIVRPPKPVTFDTLIAQIHAMGGVLTLEVNFGTGSSRTRVFTGAAEAQLYGHDGTEWD